MLPLENLVRNFCRRKWYFVLFLWLPLQQIGRLHINLWSSTIKFNHKDLWGEILWPSWFQIVYLVNGEGKFVLFKWQQLLCKKSNASNLVLIQTYYTLLDLKRASCNCNVQRKLSLRQNFIKYWRVILCCTNMTNISGLQLWSGV